MNHEQETTARRQHTPEFRTEALALADKIGVAAAARDLDLHESQLYDWRKKATAQLARSDLEKAQALEIAKLKKQLANADEEVQILKKLQRISLKNCLDTAAAKYEFVQDLHAVFTIVAMCRVLNIASSGYYAWRTRLKSGSTHQVSQHQLEAWWRRRSMLAKADQGRQD